ncbi:MAG: hypothetical protein MJ252_18305 [archaeon]|nr:hypothetical protein [archaeon]
MTSKPIPLEYPSKKLNAQSALNKNYKTTKINKAEVDAIKETEKKNESDYQKMLIYQNNMEKYKRNNEEYMTNEKLEKLKEQQRKEFIEQQKLKYKNYNLTLKDRNLSSNKRKRGKKAKIEEGVEENEEEAIPINEEEKKEEIEEINEEIPIEKVLSKEEREEQERKEFLSFKTVDLTSNLDNVLNKNNKSKGSSNPSIEDEIDEQKKMELINEAIQNKMKNLNLFRKKGIIKGVQCLDSNPDYYETKTKKKIPKPRKLTRKEKLILSNAIYTIQGERFGERKIIIPNICSCGQLQKRLQSLIKHSNFDVMSPTQYECANNCIYYKNKKEYDKCIHDLIYCVKDTKYENFKNKYKEDI